MTKILFTEKQQFRQLWLLLFILGISAVMVWGFVQQIFFGIPFGNNPAPDWMMFLLVLVPIGIFVFFFSLTLYTRVDRHGIAFRFFPVHRKERFVKWESVKSAKVRKYKPIAEYGGWGFRRGKRGIAYNTSGNMGLQIELQDGKKILLGTKKPEELQRTLEKLNPFQYGIKKV